MYFSQQTIPSTSEYRIAWFVVLVPILLYSVYGLFITVIVLVHTKHIISSVIALIIVQLCVHLLIIINLILHFAFITMPARHITYYETYCKLIDWFDHWVFLANSGLIILIAIIKIDSSIRPLKSFLYKTSHVEISLFVCIALSGAIESVGLFANLDSPPFRVDQPLVRQLYQCPLRVKELLFNVMDLILRCILPTLAALVSYSVIIRRSHGSSAMLVGHNYKVRLARSDQQGTHRTHERRRSRSRDRLSLSKSSSRSLHSDREEEDAENDSNADRRNSNPGPYLPRASMHREDGTCPSPKYKSEWKVRRSLSRLFNQVPSRPSQVRDDIQRDVKLVTFSDVTIIVTGTTVTEEMMQAPAVASEDSSTPFFAESMTPNSCFPACSAELPEAPSCPVRLRRDKIAWIVISAFILIGFFPYQVFLLVAKQEDYPYTYMIFIALFYVSHLSTIFLKTFTNPTCRETVRRHMSSWYPCRRCAHWCYCNNCCFCCHS